MRRRALTGLGCAVLVLAGCSSTGSGQSIVVDSGQAAVSSEFQVSQQRVADDLGQVLVSLGRAPGDPPPGLAAATTQRLVRNELVVSYAQANGLAVTRTEVEEGLADLAEGNGGQQALEDRAVQAGIPASALEGIVEEDLLRRLIGARLGAGDEVEAQLEAANAALASYSEQIAVSVAPRYGTWDDAALGIVPGTDLSQPAAE